MPASRNRFVTWASRATPESIKASDPAVVCMRSAVSMLSFSNMGSPCSGPRVLPAPRSASRASAISRASGLISITELSAGPALSNASIRFRHESARERADQSPEARPACNSATVSLGRSSLSGLSGATVRCRLPHPKALMTAPAPLA